MYCSNCNSNCCPCLESGEDIDLDELALLKAENDYDDILYDETEND